MTDTLTAVDSGPEVGDVAGCGCCQPRPPADVAARAEEIAGLHARREVLERRLAGFATGARS